MTRGQWAATEGGSARRSPAARFLLGAFVSCAALFGGASAAWAGTGFGVVPNFPSPVMVGQSGVPATLTITNISDGKEAPLDVTLDQITLVPSCGTLAISGADCPAAAVDPGVLRLSPTGVGEAGTVCGGVTFTTSIIDATEGKYQFTPSAPVVLGPTGSATATCRIDFTFDVVKVPTKDADPPPAGAPGLQTTQAGFAHGVASDRVPGFGGGASVTTVAPGIVPIATAVAPTPITLGSTFQDTATLTPTPGAAVPSGTVTFQVFSPGDTTCTGPLAFPVSTNPLNGAGTSATSDPFRPTATGTYRVIATYSGDPNYAPVATACGDPGEAAVVNRATLPVVTAVAPTPITLGSTFRDTATVGPPAAGLPAPTGTVTFTVFSPGDTTCTGALAFPASTNPVGTAAGVSTAVSDPFRPTATGTYRVIAAYSGDGNYAAAATACNDPGEAAVVNRTTLPVVTAVAPTPITLGSTFRDTATVGPPAEGLPAPTWTVTVTVFSPGDTTCTGAPAFPASTQPVATAAGVSTSTSDPFRPTATGTYRVVASYSGDANYSASATACNDTGEAAVVAPAPIPIVTAVAPTPLVLGGTFRETETIGPPAAGLPAPTGTVSFQVFSPGDSTCTGALAFPASTQPVATAAGVSTSTSDPFRPAAVGTYRVIARYSGDGNYAPAATACGDPGEAAVVNRATLPVVTAVAPTPITLGSTFRDTATVGPPAAGLPAPTGTVTFTVFSPWDTTCTGAPAFPASTQPV
ncbi:MAG: hypothetical protein QOD61_2364, partial [Solirubrobacteraceae bacterium]|nr:hypothetical protein [Solirubrobacteraceae bacterium]